MMCKNNELDALFNNSSDIRTEIANRLHICNSCNRPTRVCRTYQTALDLAFPLSA